MKKGRIAVLYDGLPTGSPGGLTHSVMARTRGLIESGLFDVDVFCLEYFPSRLASRLHGIVRPPRPSAPRVTINGIDVEVLNMGNSSVEDVINKLTRHRNPLFRQKMERVMAALRPYDLIAAHAHVSAEFAMEAKRRFGTPVSVTWHGSDIMLEPEERPRFKPVVEDALLHADANIFVSAALLRKAESRVAKVSNPQVLYNGTDSQFQYAGGRMTRGEVPVVGFAGTLYEVKNAQLLPEIFSNIEQFYGSKVKFRIAGDGPMRQLIAGELAARPQLDCEMLGAVPPTQMGEFYRSIDLLVTPSRSEGLPLVCIEALRCGANAVGSRVGGIAEVVGEEYTVVPGPGFEQRMAELAAKVLRERPLQTPPAQMDWRVTTVREIDLYQKLI